MVQMQTVCIVIQKYSFSFRAASIRREGGKAVFLPLRTQDRVFSRRGLPQLLNLLYRAESLPKRRPKKQYTPLWIPEPARFHLGVFFSCRLGCDHSLVDVTSSRFGPISSRRPRDAGTAAHQAGTPVFRRQLLVRAGCACLSCPCRICSHVFFDNAVSANDANLS